MYCLPVGHLPLLDGPSPAILDDCPVYEVVLDPPGPLMESNIRFKVDCLVDQTTLFCS